MEKEDSIKNAEETMFHDSVEEPLGSEIEGYDFDNGVNYSEIIESLRNTGHQASELWRGTDIVNEMISDRAKIFLGYTSNMVSSGLRDVFRYLVKHKKVHVVATTAGGVEEDIMKCLRGFKLGSFHGRKGEELWDAGVNRVGNVYIPDDRYVMFEKFLKPVFEEMYREQKEKGKVFSASDLVWKLGEKINDEKSICYWAWKNKIRIYCPAITDGAIGDVLYVFKLKNEDFLMDVSADIRDLNNESIGLEKSGVIALGSGVAKHSILLAQLFRNGCDYAVYVNTAQEFDGSDAGAMPDEAVSWKKIRKSGKAVKVFGDATVIFPIMVAESFAKD